MNIFVNVYLCISSCPHPAIVPMTHLTGNKDALTGEKDTLTGNKDTEPEGDPGVLIVYNDGNTIHNVPGNEISGTGTAAIGTRPTSCLVSYQRTKLARRMSHNALCWQPLPCIVE